MSGSIVPASALMDEVLKDMLDRDQRVRPLVEAVQQARDWRARLDAIRALYGALRADEIACQIYCGYELGLHDLFTPIERALWQSLRIEAPGELRERLRDEIGEEPDEHDMAPGLRAFYLTTACGLVLAIKRLLVDRVIRHEDQGWMLKALDAHHLAQSRIGVDW